MTIYKEKKRKEKVCYIIAIAIMVFAVACSEKPTQSSDFAEIDYDLPWVEDNNGVTKDDSGSGGSGGSGSTPTPIKSEKREIVADKGSVDSPVVVVNGDKVIVAYGQGGNIYYRASIDGGNKISVVKTLSSSAKYPYIFFNGNDFSVMVTKNNGKTGVSTKVITEVKGTFQNLDNLSEEGLSGVMGEGASAGGVGSTLEGKRYFESSKTIRTAAGAGIEYNNRQIPLSEVGGGIALILEPKQLTGAQSGWGWDLKANSKITDKPNDDVLKIAADGTTYKTSEAAEKSGGYSITKNGKISGDNAYNVGQNTTDASIAVSGDYIYTLTIEDSGLVFRKFNKNAGGSSTVE